MDKETAYKLKQIGDDVAEIMRELQKHGYTEQQSQNIVEDYTQFTKLQKP